MTAAPLPTPSTHVLAHWGAAAAEATRRIVFFPHSGAGGLSGRALATQHTEVQVHRRPGREARMSDPATVTVDACVREALAALAPVLTADRIPTVVVGHSFGALLAAECVAALEHTDPDRIERVVLSAKAPPPEPDPTLRAALEDDSALTRWLLELGGTPAELLEDPGMREVVLGPLRADLAASTSWDAPPPLLHTPVLTVAASQDPSARSEDVRRWAASTSGAHHHLDLPGGHHALFEHAARLHASLDELSRGSDSEESKGPRAQGSAH